MIWQISMYIFFWGSVYSNLFSRDVLVLSMSQELLPTGRPLPADRGTAHLSKRDQQQDDDRDPSRSTCLFLDPGRPHQFRPGPVGGGARHLVAASPSRPPASPPLDTSCLLVTASSFLQPPSLGCAHVPSPISFHPSPARPNRA